MGIRNWQSLGKLNVLLLMTVIIGGTLWNSRPGQSIKLPHKMNHPARADIYDCMYYSVPGCVAKLVPSDNKVKYVDDDVFAVIRSLPFLCMQ